MNKVKAYLYWVVIAALIWLLVFTAAKAAIQNTATYLIIKETVQ